MLRVVYLLALGENAFAFDPTVADRSPLVLRKLCEKILDMAVTNLRV
jgi:hypothetical protein